MEHVHHSRAGTPYARYLMRRRHVFFRNSGAAHFIAAIPIDTGHTQSHLLLAESGHTADVAAILAVCLCTANSRQTVRPKRRPQLYPAMRARMWKPGQSGNPSGVSKAYLEAMREMAMQPVELSPGAERMRRWRLRRQRGEIVVSLDVSPDLTNKLIRLGWLDPVKRTNKEAIAAAVVGVVERAI